MPYFLIEVDVATYQVSSSSMTHKQQQSVFSDQHETECESQANVKSAVLITTVLDIKIITHTINKLKAVSFCFYFAVWMSFFLFLQRWQHRKL